MSTTAISSAAQHISPANSPSGASQAKSAAGTAASRPPKSLNAQATSVVSAAAAALQEATESSAVTTKEATAGDRTAQRLLAKEQAPAARVSGSATTTGATHGSSVGSTIDVKA